MKKGRRQERIHAMKEIKETRKNTRVERRNVE